MKKVKFNVMLKSLDEKQLLKDQLGELNAARVIGNILCNSKDDPKNPIKDPVRLLDVSRVIYHSKDVVDLEDADYKMVRGLVEKCGASVLVLGQLLAILDGAGVKEKSQGKKDNKKSGTRK